MIIYHLHQIVWNRSIFIAAFWLLFIIFIDYYSRYLLYIIIIIIKEARWDFHGAADFDVYVERGKKKRINPQVRSTEIGSNLFSLKEKQKREIANEIMPMKSLASDATSWSFNSETLPPPPPPPIISQRSRYRNESFREMNAPSTPNQLKIQNDKISIFKNFIINEILKFKWFQFLTLS